MMNILKERIREICKNKNITLKELSKKIGIAPESLTRAMSGNPTLSTLTSISKALDIDINDLFMTTDRIELDGFIEYQGTVYRIKNKKDLDNIYRKVYQNNIK